MVELDNRTDEVVDPAGVVAVVTAVLEAEGVADAELAVLLVDEPEMQALNREHRGRDAVTDVLSFPIDVDDELPEGLPRLLGDVVVCPAQARRQAAEGGVTGGRELTTLLVHGTLHLLGYDHEADAGEMLARQDDLVDRLPDVSWTAPDSASARSREAGR